MEAAAVESSKKLTPMMQQYFAIKARFPDAIVMFRLGDFYEMFFDDAKTASRVLGLTLTSRDKGSDPTPLAGVPHHAAKGYIARLCDEGFKVAVCEQIEDPSKKGSFRREVSRVVTPGMVFDDDALDQKRENILAALASAPDGKIGLATLDVSTGRFRSTENSPALIGEELLRVQPRELVWNEQPELSPFIQLLKKTRVTIAAPPEGIFSAAAAAAELALAALQEALPQQPKHVEKPETYALDAFVGIDDTTRRNLELFATLIGGKREGSLLHHLDRCKTGMGSRLLTQWLSAPLRDSDAVSVRHGLVAHFVEHPAQAAELRDALSRLYDLERLNGRLGALQATPRDLGALRDTLALLPDIVSLLTGNDDALFADVPLRLRALCDALSGFSQTTQQLTTALVDTPPVTFKEGGIFHRGFDATIDELVHLCGESKDYLLQLELRERERTKINSLKIRFNRVFGYAIEVPKAQAAKVPADFQRRQTLANAERFTTPELQIYEEKVLHAEERRLQLEEQRFLELRAALLPMCEAIKNAARALAELDVLCAFAEVAQEGDYCRPELQPGSLSELEAARHPVVEAFVKERGEAYVPFSVRIGGDERLLVITGPNMAGKSTVLRAVALLHLLAQVGSFVPAKRAKLGLCDRIFTRVGASDNVSQGQSTFMVEMAETAQILSGATDRSLVVVDEIGRGTSTVDGLSLAWAVAEYLHDQSQSRTLFATHYHELVELQDELSSAKNFHMAVKEHKGEVVFLRELRPGGTSKSYGIEVARLAGLPPKVVARAKSLLNQLEHTPAHSRANAAPAQMQLFVPAQSGITQRLRALDTDHLTPLEALQILSDLAKQVA